MHSTDEPATKLVDEGVMLAEEKGAPLWRAEGLTIRGCISALTDRAESASETIVSGLNDWRSTVATLFTPLFLSYLATAYAGESLYENAERAIGKALEAVQSSKERWYEAEVHRVAGEIARKSPERASAAGKIVSSGRSPSRCREFLQSPPGEDWQATNAMKVK